MKGFGIKFYGPWTMTLPTPSKRHAKKCQKVEIRVLEGVLEGPDADQMLKTWDVGRKVPVLST